MAKTFQIPVVFYVEAKNYKQALEAAHEWADNAEELPEGADNVEVVTEFEHDEAGQRVLYLHPEGESLEEFNGDDGDDEDENEDDDEEDEDES